MCERDIAMFRDYDAGFSGEGGGDLVPVTDLRDMNTGYIPLLGGEPYNAEKIVEIVRVSGSTVPNPTPPKSRDFFNERPTDKAGLPTSDMVTPISRDFFDDGEVGC
jgi:hypothetical protein